MGYHQSGGVPWMSFEAQMQSITGVQNMIGFGAGTMNDLVQPPLLNVQALDLPYPKDGEVNPSICVHDGKLVCIVRHSDHNIMGRLDDAFCFVEGAPITGERVYAPSVNEGNPCRPFSMGAQLGAVTAEAAKSTSGIMQTHIVLLELDGACMTRSRPLRTGRYEKNWMPVWVDGRLRLVYAVDPLIVLDEPFEAKLGTIQKIQSAYRGSSQLVEYGDGWLGLVHSVHGRHQDPGGQVYAQRFVVFDKGLTAAKIGAPFHFHDKRGIEIVSGLAIWKQHVTVTYGLGGRHAGIAVVADDVIDRMIAAGVRARGKSW